MQSGLTLNGGLNKAAITQKAEEIIQGVLEGEISALDVWAGIKATADLFDQLKPVLREYAVNEAERNGKEYTSQGISFAIKESGTTYAYNTDPYWVDLQTAIKAHEAILRAINEGKQGPEFTNPFTGEIYTLKRPPKQSTTTVNVSLPKC
jgi:hypothetical protein